MPYLVQVTFRRVGPPDPKWPQLAEADAGITGVVPAPAAPAAAVAAPRGGLTNWADVRGGPDAPLTYLEQLVESTRVDWYVSARDAAYASLRDSGLSDDEQRFAASLLHALLPQRHDGEEPGPELDSGGGGRRYFVQTALRLLDRRLPRMVADAEWWARGRAAAGAGREQRGRGKASASAFELAMAAAAALLAFRGCEDEMQDDLDYFEAAVARLRAEAGGYAPDQP